MEKSLSNGKITFVNIVKGVMFALGITIVAVLLLAIVYKFVNMSDATIKIINQIIKILSIAIGVFICLKNDKSKGMLKGAIVGGIYTIISFFVFSILVSTFSFSFSLLYDILFASIIGLIFGIIFVNIKSKR